jgi:hypothetical protein
MAKSASVEPLAPLTLRRESIYSFQGIAFNLEPDFWDLSLDARVVGHQLRVAIHGLIPALVVCLYALHQRFHGTACSELVQEGCYGANEAFPHSHPVVHTLADPHGLVPSIS